MGGFIVLQIDSPQDNNIPVMEESQQQLTHCDLIIKVHEKYNLTVLSWILFKINNLHIHMLYMMPDSENYYV